MNSMRFCTKNCELLTAILVPAFYEAEDVELDEELKPLLLELLTIMKMEFYFQFILITFGLVYYLSVPCYFHF